MRTDQDLAVIAYQERMGDMARTMTKWADKAVDGMLSDVTDLMRRTGYTKESALQWAVRPADSMSVLRLAELVRSLPEKDRKAAMSKLMGQVGSGSLTHKKVVVQLLQLNARAMVGGLGRDVRKTLVSVATEASLRGVYMLQKELGAAWNVDGINARRIQAMARKVYGDATAWNCMSRVAKQVNQQVMQSIMLGESTDKLALRIREVKQTEVWKSKREARTKITEVSNQAHSDAYEEHGVKRYQFVATYDERTCPKCGRQDGKKYAMSEKKPGINYPPLHPNCRCTTVAVLSKEVEEMMAPRILTDKKTGKKVEIPRDFTYEDWYDRYGPGRDGKKFDAGAAESDLKAPGVGMKAENMPSNFTSKDESANTQKLVQFINSKQDANPKVVSLYNRMEKLRIATNSQELTVKHDGTSCVYPDTFEICIPRLEGDDITGAATTTLHEQMHMMDMYCRDQNGVWNSVKSAKMKKVFSNPLVMGPESKKIIGEYEKECARIRSATWTDYLAKRDELLAQYKAGKMTSKECQKLVDAKYQEWYKEFTRQTRNASGGGMDMFEDIHDAMSHGHLAENGTLTYGHRVKYYSRPGSDCRETIANYGALSISRPDLVEVLRREYPEMVDALDELIDDMLKKSGA